MLKSRVSRKICLRGLSHPGAVRSPRVKASDRRGEERLWLSEFEFVSSISTREEVDNMEQRISECWSARLKVTLSEGVGGVIQSVLSGLKQSHGMVQHVHTCEAGDTLALRFAMEQSSFIESYLVII